MTKKETFFSQWLHTKYFAFKMKYLNIQILINAHNKLRFELLRPGHPMI